MTLGVVLVSVWMATALIDWHEARKRKKEERDGQPGS
jgi:hypothetical protein